ncbi:bifunctional protein-serine/threonine kinase/phosphatase [Catenovulum sediminis]|uniref:bifunctional protein-serine/threonine kinase/phosphatase n=1 Tax=Catenovulum sediminis TaxID=1740262 RepID=UPI00118170DE|nr:bifunctional protein-serine/threonine kinase/phosphatase [Catenovulum sediminis]
MKSTLSIEIGGSSIAGVKPVNQDAFAAQIPKGQALDFKGVAVAIADGISSSRRSQEAAQLCVTQFITDYYSTPDTWNVNKSAARILTALNSWLHNENRKKTDDGLVCTLSTLVIKSCTAHLFHIGDSRIYRMHDGDFHCLTRDHVHGSRSENFLTRAMGIDSHLEVDYQTVDDLKVGDYFILSTDGLHNFVSESTICKMVSQAEDLVKAAEELAAMAVENGSDDNISCVILRIDSLPHEDVEEAHRRISKLVIPPVLEAGQSIDGFTVRRVLFSGTRSHVFLVEDQDKNQFALKMPSHGYRDEPEYLDGFLREEWIGTRLKHRNVMRIHARPENSPFMYHLCEYLGGQNLRQWMMDNPKPSLDEVRKIITEVVHALRYFQRNGMVHRDLKPENVIIDKFGQIKVIDFGTVAVEGLEDILSPIEETCPVGSVDYIAPEYLMGHKGTFQADLYSVAVMFYEMYVGQLPFELGNLRNKIPDNYNFWRYRSAKDYRVDAPKWLDIALEKATSPNPSYRHQAFSEFLADISSPNQTLMRRYESKPLIERNPIQFWKISSLLLFVSNLLLIYLLLNR